jgi:formamidopyrimidine-DNA glycosylase
MSAGRLQLFDGRASVRDRSSASWCAPPTGRELSLAGVRHRAGGVGEAGAKRGGGSRRGGATLGPDASPAPSLDEFAGLLDQPRHLHPLLRDQRTIAGSDGSWVDQTLSTACLSPSSGPRTSPTSRWGGAPRGVRRGAGRRPPPPRAGHRRCRSGQDADAAAGGASPRRRGRPRCGARIEAIHFKDYVKLLPGGADGRANAEGPAPPKLLN